MLINLDNSNRVFLGVLNNSVGSNFIGVAINDSKYNKNFLSCDNSFKKSNHSVLNINVVSVMLNRFLNENKMTRKKISETLNITVSELMLLLLGQASFKLIAKINLPLIKLYCSTCWNKVKI